MHSFRDIPLAREIGCDYLLLLPGLMYASTSASTTLTRACWSGCLYFLFFRIHCNARETTSPPGSAATEGWDGERRFRKKCMKLFLFTTRNIPLRVVPGDTREADSFAFTAGL
jgi:hypothetical protein